MVIANLFFFSALAFLAGSFLSSFGSFTLALVVAILFLPKNRKVGAIIGACFIVGFAYAVIRTGSERSVAPNDIQQPAIATVVSDRAPTPYGFRYTGELDHEMVRIVLYSGNGEFLFGDRVTAVNLRPLGYPYQGIALAADISGEAIVSEPSLLRGTQELKARIRGLTQELFPKDEAQLLGGIVYGDRPDPDLRQSMIRSGTLHIAVVSGQNITMLARIVERSLAVLPFHWRLGATGAAMAAFAAFVGPEPSTLRALLMGLLVILATSIGRLPLRRNILIAAALFITVLDPVAIRSDVGFWLSFLAATGILYLAPLLERIIPLQILRETISAQIMTLPLTLHLFGTVSLNALVANLLVLPLIPYVMASGLIVVAAAIIFLPVAQVPAFPLALILRYLVVVISFLGSFGFLEFRIPLIATLATYAFLGWRIWIGYRGKIIDANFTLENKNIPER